MSVTPILRRAFALAGTALLVAGLTACGIPGGEPPDPELVIAIQSDTVTCAPGAGGAPGFGFACSGAFTLTITNDTDAAALVPITINLATVTNSFAGAYTTGLVPCTTAPLAAGASCIVPVTDLSGHSTTASVQFTISPVAGDLTGHLAFSV